MNKSTSILVILPSPMGDAILATPALRMLSRAMPEANVSWLGNKVGCEILEAIPWADERLTYQYEGGRHPSAKHTAEQLRSRGFDAVILLSNSFRTAWLSRLAGIPRRIGYARDGRGGLLTDALAPIRLGRRYPPFSMLAYYHRIMAYAVSRLTGKDLSDTELAEPGAMELATTEANQAAIEDCFQRWHLTDKPAPIIMVPGAAYGTSKLWPAERFAELADRLIDRFGRTIILSCAPNDTERRIAESIAGTMQGPCINLAEQPVRLGELKELIRRSELMIANDTGPCHIAAAMGTALVTLFGPTDPRWTATGYANEIRLRHDIPCGPCQQSRCHRAHDCMRAIHVDEAFDAAAYWLEHDKANPPSTDRESVVGRYYQPFAESFVPLPGFQQGLVHRDYRERLAHAGLLGVDEVFGFTGGESLSKPGLGHRERFRVTLPPVDSEPPNNQVEADAPSAGSNTGQESPRAMLYLKRYHSVSPAHRLGQWLKGKRELESGDADFAATMTLGEHGIAVSRPVGFGVGADGRSFSLTESLPGCASLEQCLQEPDAPAHQYALLADRRRLIGELAQLVHQFHHSGFCHRDLYLCHVFLSRDTLGEERVNLIDLQRVFKPRHRVRRWRVKDLAQLLYSAEPFIRRTEAMRFLLAYDQCPKLRAWQKQLIREILRKVARIRRHDQRRQRRGH